MTPINRQTIEAKLLLLEKNIALLKVYKKKPKAVFFQDDMLQGASMHYLVESIEIIVDIGNHILAQAFQQSQTSYKDVLLHLGKHKVIPIKFAQRQAKMADFRNLIIHGYGDIKLNEVYHALRTGPDIFAKFTGYYVKWLNKH